MFYGGERGIRTLDTGFPVYSLSRRAPSAYSAISPLKQFNVQGSKFNVEIKTLEVEL